MKSLIAVLTVLVLLLSCKEKHASPSSDVEICGKKDPINNLRWLRDLVQKAKDDKEEGMLSIVAVTVQGKTVINYYKSYMSCMGCINYNCDGSKFDAGSLSEAERVEFQKNIWGDGGKRVVLMDWK